MQILGQCKSGKLCLSGLCLLPKAKYQGPNTYYLAIISISLGPGALPMSLFKHC